MKAEILQKSRKKVFTGSELGPITRLHRRGAALRSGDAVRLVSGPGPEEFFDIVDM